MIFSTLMNRKSRYEVATVQRIRIQPTILVPAAISDSYSEDEEFQIDFDTQKIVNDGKVFWIEENNSSDDDVILHLPGSVEDDDEVVKQKSFEESSFKDTSTEPVFNLLPGGKRKKRSLRS